MVLKVEINGFMMKVFAPNKKNSSCQEMVGQYLKGLSIGNLYRLGLRLKAKGSRFRIQSSRLKSSRFVFYTTNYALG